jgi:hypothetical protein
MGDRVEVHLEEIDNWRWQFDGLLKDAAHRRLIV